jgi:microcystin-dependent protein
MSATLWNIYPSPIIDSTGEIASGARAYFYTAGTNDLTTVYTDSVLSVPHSNPVIANSLGIFAPVYIPAIDYRVRVTTAANVVIFDADGIKNTETGGGGGGSTPDERLFNTGFILPSLSPGSISGFVRMNGRTVGSGTSGATERQNDDTEDLFLYLWNNFPNSICAVSSGRGSSAAADWAAAKTIVVPSTRGRMLIGVDDMGASAANVIQVTTTASVTNGSPTVTVASATGLARGMSVIIAGVAAGTITNINGAIITLSSNYGGSTVGSAAFRASPFADAQEDGASGGALSYTLSTLEIPAHTHSFTDTHTHTVQNVVGDFGIVGGQFSVPGTFTLGSKTSSAYSSGLTINNTGGGAPFYAIPPSILVSFHIKL